MTTTLAQEVWNTLSDTDVTDHIEVIKSQGNRPDVKYLPWHKAWLLVKRKFPGSTYTHLQDLHHLSESMEVEVEVNICKVPGGDSVTSSARLPVMDHRFNAILSPDATEINKSRQRCLVKALAFAGLGLNLWSESPLPVGKLDDPINAKQVKIIEELIKKAGVEEAFVLEWLGVDSVKDIPIESYPKAKVMLQSRCAS